MVDSSMYKEFVAEAKGYLAELDTAFNKLEEGYDTPANRIDFAGILHDMLESSRFAGLSKTPELLQEMENLLALNRDSETPFNRENLSLLGEGKEKIVLIVEELDNHNTERTDIQNILEKFKNYGAQLKNSISGTGQEADESVDDFSDIFDTFDVEEATFEEPPEILAELSEEEKAPPVIATGDASPPNRKAETAEFSEPAAGKTSSSAQNISNQSVRPVQHRQNTVPDATSLQEEIQSTEQEQELFQVFIQQLGENISLLKILVDSLSEISDKSEVIGKCSDLISKLHSSANYMGYDKLTDFYGQWIAELEMSDMEMSMGNQVSFDFMHSNIRMLTELFPQIEEVEKVAKPDASAGTGLPEEDLFSDDTEKELPASPAAVEPQPKPDQDDEDDDFSDLFSTFGDFEESDFEEEEAIAALSDEDQTEASPDEQDLQADEDSSIPGLEEKLSHFFDEPEEEPPYSGLEPIASPLAQSEDEEKIAEKKTPRHKKLVTDTESLKEEIESEEYDEELFQIFVDQLQENISQLRTLADNFSKTPNKPALIKRCSDLVTALHSSANYMGYERLTEFYGQWIAELEMTDLQLSIGVPFAMDFMDLNIKTIVEIFPQVKDVPADVELPQPPSAETPPESSSPGLTENDEIEPVAAFSDSDLTAPEDDNEAAPAENVEYDEVKAVFSEDDDESDEEFEFDDIFDDETEPLETDNRRKELFERLSGALESLAGEPAEDGEQQFEQVVALLQDEIEQGVVGQERFKQFIRSSGEDVGKLQDLNDTLEDAVNQQQALQEYSDIIARNISLAESMEYERLENFYSRWHQNIAFSIEALDEYEPANLDYLTENINILCEVFKNYLTIPDDSRITDETAPALPNSDSKQQAPSYRGDKEDSGPSEQEQQLFDKLSRALDAEEEMSVHGESIAAFDEDVDRQLFDKLSSALEEKEFSRHETGMRSIDDVVNEILSGDGVSVGQPAPGPMNDMVQTGSAVPASIFSDIDETQSKEAVDQQEISIRVDADKIDQLMDQVEELMASRTNLTRLFNEFDHVHADLSNAGYQPESLRPLNDYADKLNRANAVLGRITGELTEGVLSVRKVPIGNLFRQYPNIVRDMVRDTGKKIKFKIEGEDTLLDQGTIDAISTPLAHILQNSIAHGIELPAERIEAGKDETGTLLLEAYPETNAVVIEISDDGRGIDPVEVKNKALEKHIVSEEQLSSMTEAEVIRLIMEPGFATAAPVSDLSENRAGLHTVKRIVNELKGTIDISSEAGQGMLIRIKIPLVLSVIQALGIEIGSMVLTVPVTNVVETTRVRWPDINDTDGVELITHRDMPLPVFRLNEILNIQADAPDAPYAYILVVQAKDQRAGLIVDGFRRPRETVVKPLAEYLRKESGFSGATILDNGSISLVLDTATLLEIIKNRSLNEIRQEQLENALKGVEAA